MLLLILKKYLDLPTLKEIKTTVHRTVEALIKTVTVSATPCGHDDASVLVDKTQHCVAPIV
ncbi:hypothetical protein EBR43_01450 [bacterium]|nr:hypothetical protein [bacterium]NBX71807.1 hypothetical protein [bacterium]